MAQPCNKKKRKVLVVDDYPIVRGGLAQLINKEPDLFICGEFGDADLALKAVEALKPDVAIVDIFFKASDGIELIKNLKGRISNLPILVFSMQEELVYAPRALRAGARGYLMKQEPTEKVLIGLRQVLSGVVYLSDRMANRMLEIFVGDGRAVQGRLVDRLSDRELEVFRFIGQGHGTRRIAEKLRLSIKTVESYREHIKEKMRLKDSSELVHQAIRWVSEDKLI